MTNEELLKKIAEFINPIAREISHIKTAVEALKAGQDDILEQLARKADKADVKRLEQKIDKKIQDHEGRIEHLELPHKN